MLIDLGKIIGGPDEGDGLVGSMLGVVALGGAAVGTGLLDDVGGSAVVDGFSAAASGFGEAADIGLGEARGGIFRWFGSLFENASFIDYLFAYDIARDGFSGRAKQAWGTLSDEAKKMVAAHGFIRQQLHEQGLDALAAQYRDLGASLPDEALLKKAYRALSSKLHSDRNPHGEELMKNLNAARQRIEDPRMVADYEAEIAFKRGAVEEMLGELDKNTKSWAERYEATSAAQAKERIAKGQLLEGTKDGERAGKTFRQVLGELSANQKIGLAFAGAVTVGLGVWIGTRLAEQHKQKKKLDAFSRAHPLPLVDSVLPIERVKNPPQVAASKS